MCQAWKGQDKRVDKLCEDMPKGPRIQAVLDATRADDRDLQRKLLEGPHGFLTGSRDIQVTGSIMASKIPSLRFDRTSYLPSGPEAEV